MAIAAAGVVLALTTGWDRWSTGPLIAIAALAIVSDLMSVQTAVAKLQVSGTLLGLMLAAVLLGGGPAALIGVLTIAVGWVRWREPPFGLGTNFVTYAWFPLASGAFFHEATHVLQVDAHQLGYYFLVLPTFLIGLLLNWGGLAAYQCYIDRSSFTRKIRDVLGPVLAAELFSAVLLGAALFFVVKTGTIGIAILAVVLIIFQYLVGELLKSQQRAEALRRKATTDELTGLSNRAYFTTVIQEKIAVAQQSGERFAVMLLDLDRFKEINDTLGHHYGDVLLRDLSPRLAACVGSGGLVARLGGDEFAVLPDVAGDVPQAIKKAAEKLLDCVREPVVVDELTLGIGASIGITRYPDDGEDVHDMLRRADVAMYSAKEDHAGWKLYENRLDRYSLRRFTVLNEFRQALESEQFVLHYQPVVAIDGSSVHGAEALVRWEHPELGMVPPNDFIPIAEQSGLIGHLTHYVLERAVAECKAWRSEGRDLSVAVNLSVRDLLDLDLPGQVASVLTAHGLPSDALHLEITESMIMSDPDRALETVMHLRDLGAHISVDDFGTGYSSLANLKRLPISELKIDRSFISSLPHDESDLIIVGSTINLGHDLRLKVIAEGVEDEITLKRLANLGCDLAQGYYFGRPLPSQEFVRLADLIGASAHPPLASVESLPSVPRRSQAVL
ncbi:MAG TPA: EAL domain-containing protein [Solirubrobacteraceae bacterium]|nr:EAL domain-containing protein [Solirubrobacteraceae bacterium]